MKKEYHKDINKNVRVLYTLYIYGEDKVYRGNIPKVQDSYTNIVVIICFAIGYR